MAEPSEINRPNGPLNGKFEYKKNQDGTVDRQKVLCTLCWKEFSFHRSTSSLKYHLNAKHRLVVDSAAASAPRLPKHTATTRRDLSKFLPPDWTDTIAKGTTAVKPSDNLIDMV